VESIADDSGRWDSSQNLGLGRKWLKENSIDLDLPDDSTVLAFSLNDESPNYLWEPIFRVLGRSTESLP